MGKEETEVQTEVQSKRRRFPWVRLLLFIAYVVLGVAWGLHEANGQKVLFKARQYDEANAYETAGLAYMVIVEKFPATFASIEARVGHRRIKSALEEGKLPERLGRTRIEEALGERFDPYVMHWFPFAASTAASVLLLGVLLTRLRRPGLAFLAFVFLAVSSSATAAQLALYGFVQQVDLAKFGQEVMSDPVMVHIGAYALLGVALLLTLTATRISRND